MESLLRVPDLTGHVVPVDMRLLQEHMQAPLVLSQRVTGDLIDKSLQSLASLLDERVLEKSVVATERKLPLPRFAGQCWNDDLKISTMAANEQRRRRGTMMTMARQYEMNLCIRLVVSKDFHLIDSSGGYPPLGVHLPCYLAPARFAATQSRCTA